VLAAAAYAFFRGADSVPMRPDEAFYALIADNIRRGGQWLFLQHWWLPDASYLDKPPLYFWLSAATDWAIGYRPLAFRLCSGLLGLGAVACTALIGRTLHGPAAGLLAGLLLAMEQSFLLFYGARDGTLNSGIGGCVALGLLAAVAPWGAARPGRAALVLAAAGIAAGWLKPFNGLIVLGLAVAAGLCQPGPRRQARLRAAAWAAGPILAANLAWPALMWVHYGAPFADYFFGSNIWQRFSRGVDPGHLQPWFFYARVPSWLLRAGWAAAGLRLALRRGRGSAERILFLVPLLYLAAISLSVSKLPQYAVPALPLLAVAGGALLAQGAALLPGRWTATAAAGAVALAIFRAGLAPVDEELAERPPLPWWRPGCPASEPPGRDVAVLLAGFSSLAAVEDEGRNRELEFEIRGFRDRMALVDAEGLARALQGGGPALVFLRRGSPAEAGAGALAATPPLASYPTRYGPPGVTDALALGLDPRCR
jgi:4-amino-4-deoxy-L-arabinose transferase-like glycosyltransferase